MVEDNTVYRYRYAYNNHYLISWCTKQKKPVFVNQKLQKEIAMILNNLAQKHHLTIENVKIESNTIQLLISFSPKHSITEAIKILKGGSAVVFLKKHKDIEIIDNHLWSASYYSKTINKKGSSVKDYLSNPKYINK